ncbi:hypothetical protein RSA37_11950 [Mammaliicoccus sciuri]|uniref:hypothetical protein n=1 Tax=Mammaliicoccus sciuri TaxID=1296 RepID=UPI000734B4EC|nr:hypothetical protein [Mammaliicoccus sciuri]KTT82737.1 hypothetical protein NS1R_12210 [Mammaliicoccus sciuri]KTT88206.1 hypothetical protein NS112_09280 [Mammaliicoccus sciuri]KTT89749.1 hypothetical protein NS36R_07805 [Mammaliicoccus sciuri]KTT94141.1 hypothetical protein NS44R_08220 [Mammaliicoccus sciuri]KTW10753.1 hypothetical protein RSA37_11950 [Mammaliicoccus sciuri]
MEYLKFLLYQAINNPAFFDVKAIEVVEVIVNLIMTFVTFLSVLIALISVFWAIRKDKRVERNQNLKTLNMVNHITSIQRRNLSNINNIIIGLLTYTVNVEIKDEKFFDFNNKTYHTKSAYVYSILTSIQIIDDKNISSKLSDYKDELSKILFEYHMHLSIDATNKVSYNLNLINAALKNIEYIENSEIFKSIDYIEDHKVRNELLSRLKNITKLIDDSTKPYKKEPTN